MSTSNNSFTTFKNRIVLMLLKEKNFCGLPLKEIKLILNRLAKRGNSIAAIYREVLEAECCSIKAKTVNKSLARIHYYNKSKHIMKALDLCLENCVICGYQICNDGTSNHIIYFDLPGTATIAFHNNINQEQESKYPVYEKSWSGNGKCTIKKLESGILALYEKEIIEKRNLIDATIKNKPLTHKVIKCELPKISKKKKNCDYYKDKMKKTNHIVSISTYDAAVELLKSGEFYDYYVKTISNNKAGMFKMFGKNMDRKDLVLDENNCLYFYTHRKFADCEEYESITKVSNLCYLFDDQETICKKNNFIKFYKKYIVLPEYQSYDNYAQNWSNIMAELYKPENRNKYIEIIPASQKGLCYYMGHRFNIVVDVDNHLVLHDFPPLEHAWGKLCIKVSDVNVDNDKVTNMLIKKIK